MEEGTEGAGRGIWQAGREEEERREEQEEDRVKVKEPLLLRHFFKTNSPQNETGE